MARLNMSMGQTSPIPASAHFRAVAYLRGRLFLNGFRRKGGTGELVARVLLYPIFAAFALGPTIGTGFASYEAVSTGNLVALNLVYWAVFTLWVLVSINISPPGLSFDPESLIRFPLSFPRYVVIRLFLGLLAASTVIGTMALLASVVGIGIAQPSLIPIALAAVLTFALANILFTRMVFAWVDRWLSTRRAREVFTGILFAIGIGFQYLNVTYNGIGSQSNHAQQAARIAAAAHFLQSIQPIAACLPPGLASGAILHAADHQTTAALAGLVAILLYAAVFLAVFSWRTHREFQGEALSDTITPSEQPAPRPTAPQAVGPGWTTYGLSTPVAAIFQKELTYVRRSTTQLYGLLAPVGMVVIFAGRLGTLSHAGMAFPLGMGYSILGLAALSYNSFGLDQAGVQFYFLAPVRFRSVLVAKNLLIFLITAVQVALVYGVVAYAAGTPPLLLTLTTLLWVAFATLANTAVGNLRSFTAPKKLDPGKLARKQASQLSGLMSVGLMLLAAGLTAGLYILGQSLSRPWLPIPILIALSGCSLFTYLKVLDRADTIALQHRESLIEELSKAS